jgi:hypothetical protein
MFSVFTPYRFIVLEGESKIKNGLENQILKMLLNPTK